MNNVTKIICLLASLLLSSQLFAKTMYITDSFEAPLRTGQTNAYRILAYPTSGTAMQVLEVNKETGYSKVKTGNGTQGWIKTQFLVNTPIAKDRLLQAQKQLESLKKENEELSGGQSTANKTAENLTNENSVLKTANSKLEQELAYIKEVSGNTIQINERNKQLMEEHQQLKNEFDLLNSDNDRLKDNASNQYFMLGAGAILLGIILGLVLPLLKPKRKDSGWV